MFPMCAIKSMWPFAPKMQELSISFLSLMPHLEDVYPIVPSKDVVLPWVKEAEQVSAQYNDIYAQGRIHGGAHKCSGIIGLHHKGWILQSWHDFVIETNGDGESFVSHLPSSAPNEVIKNQAVGHFAPSKFGSLPSTSLPANTLRGIVKLHTPWTFRMTPGWGLMMLPVEYIKEHRFTSAIGIINPRISQQLNPILYWHVLSGSTLVKAGTPLCRLVPVPINDRWTMTVRRATPDEYAYFYAQHTIVASRWSRAYGVLGRLYDKVVRQ